MFRTPLPVVPKSSTALPWGETDGGAETAESNQTMTSKTDKLRAVFLTALMIGSVFAAGIAFTGSAAAAVGDISNESLSPGTAAPDTSVDYEFNSTIELSGTDGTDTIRYQLPTTDADSVVDSEFESLSTDSVVVTGPGGAEVSGASVSTNDANTDGAADELVVEFDAGSSGDYDVFVNGSVTTPDTEDIYTVSIGGSDADTTSIDGTLGDIAVTDGQSPAVSGAVAYDAGTDGSTETIEVAFNDEVWKNNTDVSDTTNALDEENFTVYVNGESQGLASGAYSATSGSDGHVTITLDSAVEANDEVVVNVGPVQDDAGNSATPGNVSVRVSSQTVDVTGGTADSWDSPDSNAFSGEVVALNFQDNYNDDFEIRTEDEFIFSGSTGTNSDIYLFDTTDRNTSAAYSFDGTNAAYTLGLRNLGLDASVDADSFTDAESITGELSANAGGRPIEVTLLNDEDEEVTTNEVTLDGSGDGTYSFDAQDTGNYTVEATDVDSGVTASTETVEVTSAAEADSEIVDVETVERGDISEFNVSLTNAETANVTVGELDEDNYQANITVTDENGDGYVTFYANTYAMGELPDRENAFYTAADSDDTLTVVEETELSSTIADGDYEVTVRHGGGDFDESADDISRLNIDEGGNVDAQNIWTASSTDLDVDEVITDGTLTQDDTIAAEDYAVHQINASGIYGVFEAQDADSATAAFADAYGNDNVTLSIEQTDETVGQNQDAKVVQIADSVDNDDLHVVTDAENETFYVVSDVDELALEDDEDIETGDAFNATFSLNENTDLVEENQSVSAEYEVVEETTELEYDGQEIELANEDNVTVSGTTTLADGTSIDFRLESEDVEGDGYILQDQENTVEDGEFEANFNLSDAAVNDTFTIEVTETGTGDDLASADGIVVEGGTDETTTTTEEEETTTTTEEEEDTTTTTEETTTEETTTEETTTEETTEDPGDGDTGGEDGGSIPGFGVGIALVAILGAALLALRE